MSLTESLTEPEKSVSPPGVLPPYTRYQQHDQTVAPSRLSLAVSSSTPTPDHCLAHLRLLEAFRRLREDVVNLDGLYGVHNRFVDELYPGTSGADPPRDQLRLRAKEKRWAVYVTKAERRYDTWWRKIQAERSSMPAQHALLDIYERFEQGGTNRVFAFDEDTLPPLGQPAAVSYPKSSLRGHATKVCVS